MLLVTYLEQFLAREEHTYPEYLEEVCSGGGGGSILVHYASFGLHIGKTGSLKLFNKLTIVYCSAAFSVMYFPSEMWSLISSFSDF